MNLKKAVSVVFLGLLLSGCALFTHPKLACKMCWKPPPCTGEWFALADGGCGLVVYDDYVCPKSDGGEQ